jgi:hypothetical protein
MVNPFKEINWNPNPAECRKFAKSLILGFPSIAIFFSIVGRLTTHTWNPFFLWLGVFGLSVGVVLWLLPQIAKPFYVAWYFVACSMGIVVGNVLLSAFYFLVITPIGLAMHAAGRQLLRKGFDKNAVTYWRDAEKSIDPQRYYRQF